MGFWGLTVSQRSSFRPGGRRGTSTRCISTWVSVSLGVPGARDGLSGSSLTDALFISLCLITRVMLVRRNKAKDAAQTNAEGVVVNNNSLAFEDLTDLQNPDFRYSF